MSASGALLFARYAYPPNELGYCGPEDHTTLLEYVAAGAADGGLIRLASEFDGAWPYLSLIAHENGLEDPLDESTVEAYWIGNGLLHNVDMSHMGEDLAIRFRSQAGPGWEAIAAAVPAGARPHHSFHVFCVYTWLGLLRAGHTTEPLHVLDRCRVRVARVLSIAGDTATVRYQELAWDGHLLVPGALAEDRVTISRNGYALDAIAPGDLVSLHWHWACERLSPRRAAALLAASDHQLAIANSLPHPVAAALS
jgi:hypothetical protein